MKSFQSKISSIVLQTLIWSLLISIAYWYLSSHPAEKVGIFSSLDVVFQKATSLNKIFHGWSWKDIDDLDQYKNSFAELKSIVASKACEKAVAANQLSNETLDQLIQSLDSLSAEDFSANKTKYISVFTTINKNIQTFCKTE